MSFSKTLEYASYVGDTVSPFFAIVNIAKILALQVQTEVEAVLNSVFTVAGLVLGGLVGGARHILTGGLMGATGAGLLAHTTNIVTLTEYLMNSLPVRLRNTLVTCCEGFLYPFRYIDMTVENIKKFVMPYIKNFREKFIKIIQDFFERFVKSARILTT